MDPFTTLGIEPRFSLDLGELEQRHRDLSRALHPDRYVGRPASERRLALSKAIEVNEAWRLLRDPVKRAEAVMRHFGVDVVDKKEPQAPPAFLMEMMEAREALSDARASKDRDALTTLTREMSSREQAVVTRLAAELDQHRSPETLRELVPVLGELRYVRRFLEEASAAEDELP